MKLKALFASFMILGLALSGNSFRACAASASPLRFEETAWDFGLIKEADGPVSHVFHFVNLSSKSMSITMASSGCSCTTVAFDRSAVAPGDASEVEIIFDPAGQTGLFHQSIVLVTGSGNDSYRLTIEGVVAEREKDVDLAFPYAMVRGLQASSRSARFGFAPQGGKITKRIGVANTSESDIQLAYSLSKPDPDISVKAPHTLKVGETATVDVTFAPAQGRLGTLDNAVLLYPEGTKPGKGVVLEGYAVKTVESGPGSPSLRFQPTMVDFGKVRPNRTARSKAELFNDGKEKLVVLKVECPEGISVNLKAGTEIEHGSKLTMDITLRDPSAGPQSQYKIRLFTNDPLRPVRDVVCKITAK